ncbi:MAG: hypothetical protein GY849_02315 [Deltaproteobacteria bacterium]|nr:hypothetical protein [Deltaproteobacteria bacterium]
MKKIIFKKSVVFTTDKICKLYLSLLNLHKNIKVYVDDNPNKIPLSEILAEIKVEEITKENYKKISEILKTILWTSSAKTHSVIGDHSFFECVDLLDDENGKMIDLFE